MQDNEVYLWLPHGFVRVEEDTKECSFRGKNASGGSNKCLKKPRDEDQLVRDLQQPITCRSGYIFRPYRR